MLVFYYFRNIKHACKQYTCDTRITHMYTPSSTTIYNTQAVKRRTSKSMIKRLLLSGFFVPVLPSWWFVRKRFPQNNVESLWDCGLNWIFYFIDLFCIVINLSSGNNNQVKDLVFMVEMSKSFPNSEQENYFFDEILIQFAVHYLKLMINW